MVESIVNKQVKLISTPEKYRCTIGFGVIIGSLIKEAALISARALREETRREMQQVNKYV